jgi:hypothetical protein
MADDLRETIKDVLKTDGQRIWAEIKANASLLKACPRHKIDPEARRFGKKSVCLNCHGQMDLGEWLSYTAGYKAAGGNPDDVWPGWVP